MKVKLAFGSTGKVIQLPDSLDVSVIEPIYRPGINNEIEAVRTALRQPIGSPSLRELVGPNDKVGIIVNDITRPTPYHKILPPLLEEIRHVPKDQILLFNATGTHRGNSQQELKEILGVNVVNDYKIIQNNATDYESHVCVGRTYSGNDVWLNKDYVSCSIRIATGFIEPHFFAGFSGGGKAIMPGLARLDTIMNNHNPTFIDNANANWGITTGNPLWEEINEAAQLIPCHFLLNVTLNAKKQITCVFAGNLNEAHQKGCEFVKNNAMISVDKKFDIVITTNSGYPLDINLYQSVKGMSAASRIVKNKGAIIIAAECKDGLPDNGSYHKLLKKYDCPEELLQVIRAPGFQCKDMWQAQIHALICQKADVYVYSKYLTSEQLNEVMMKQSIDIGSTVNNLVDKFGSDAKICVLPEGPQTIPYLSKSELL